MKKKMKNLAVILGASALILGQGCVDDDQVELKEPVVAAPAPVEPKHEFKVDKDSGKIEFKAEIVYFNFDDHTLTNLGMERLSALAQHMNNNKNLTLKIQGHSDNRGSAEYNLALGQRRAQSVKAYLQQLNVSDKNLVTVSFGEEKPAAEGADEQSWAKNRRAEFHFTEFTP